MVIKKLTNLEFSFAAHAHDIFLDSTALPEKIDAASFVVTCTAYNREYLQTLCLNGGQEKIHTNYHGLDFKKFDSVFSRNKNKSFHILSVGSLLECKGFNYLIEACAELYKRGIPFECIIVGGGKLEKELKQLISQYQLEHVIKLVGYVTQDRIVDYYQWADVFALAAVIEMHWGIPNVLIEAMASKIPVICTPLPSLKEIIENHKSGIIIPNRNSKALAQALQKLYEDANLRESIIKNAYTNAVNKFDEQATHEFLSQLFYKDND